MKIITTIILLFTTIFAYSQTEMLKVIGIYSDGITKLELRIDSTFVLTTPDYVFPYTFDNYQTYGKWTLSDGEVILNPNKSPRTPILFLTEKIINNADFVEIKINYQTELYENEILRKREQADFQIMTLYLNKSKNYIHLVHSPTIRACAFAPKVKKQYVLDSSNTIKLPLQKLNKIGIYTYGLDTTIQLIPKDENSNYFEVTIIQPIDKERMPRNKKVIVKGTNAFFYENNGKVLTSGLLLNQLEKMD